jgi:hypothetical protein
VNNTKLIGRDPITCVQEQESECKIDQDGSESEENIGYRMPPLAVLEFEQGHSTFQQPKECQSGDKYKATVRRGYSLEVSEYRFHTAL